MPILRRVLGADKAIIATRLRPVHTKYRAFYDNSKKIARHQQHESYIQTGKPLGLKGRGRTSCRERFPSGKSTRNPASSKERRRRPTKTLPAPKQKSFKLKAGTQEADVLLCKACDNSCAPHHHHGLGFRVSG